MIVFKYILCVIDCFTKFAWGIPVKSKNTTKITNTMAKILINHSPKLSKLDIEKKFYNKTFDTLMTKYNIKNIHYIARQKRI